MFLKLRNTSENWGWGAEEITEEVILGSHKFRKLWFKQFSNGDVDVVNMRGSVPCAVFRLMNRFTFMAGFFASVSAYIMEGTLALPVFQGCQTNFHRGPHPPHNRLQRAKCDFRTV